MLVDSHCHLDSPEFSDDLDEVVERARAAGVGAMVTISTVLAQAETLREISGRFDGVYCTVGVHPHEAKDHAGVSAADLEDLCTHPTVVGIGETGLDYHYDHSPREDQQKSFRTHITAARVTGLPLVIHSRGADEDTVEILAEEMEIGPFKGLIHCFSTTRGLAEGAMALGLYISVAGIVTFKAAEDLRDTVRDLPLDRLLVETDSPFLAPVPNRGNRNEPAFVVHTARHIADLKGIPLGELEDATTGNFFDLFDRAERPSS
jgi:TatD DNase family protein